MYKEMRLSSSLRRSRQDEYGVDNQVTQTTTKLGCINAGEITCKVQVGEKKTHEQSMNLLAAGQEPRIKLAFRNSSSTPVKAVAMKLRQMSYQCKNNKQSTKREEEAAARRSEVSRTMSSTHVPLLDTVIGTQHTMLDTFVMPALPYQTANTYEGDSKYTRHELKITLITGLGHSNITLRVPVTVFGGTSA